MMVTGVVAKMTAESAARAALGAGAIVMEEALDEVLAAERDHPRPSYLDARAT
jgi:hypothetical protein